MSVLASQILFQVEKFQAFCFQLPNITMDLRGIKTWFGYPQKRFQPPQLVGVMLLSPAKDEQNPFNMKA